MKMHGTAWSALTGTGAAWMKLGIVTFVCGSSVLAQRPVATRDGSSSDARRSSEMLLTRRVTVALDQVSLQTAIDTVSQLVRAFIQYRSYTLSAYPQLVNIHVTDTPLGIVLERILNGTPLHAVPDGQGNLVIRPIADSTRSDSVPTVGMVTGRVVDSVTGRGIVGAIVKVVGTKRAVVVSDSGRFTLKGVPVGDHMITVRSFGYRPADRTVTVTDGTPVVVRIAMAAAPNVLSGVVTTAAGVQRRIEVGNDITTLNVDSVMKVAPVMTVTDLLETVRVCLE